jgi:predicted TIM-barrel fold metal-dependent hydrolase
MIVDVHLHLGADTTFDSDRTEEQLLAGMKRAGIDKIIVQPAQWNTYLEITQRGHDRIAAFAQKHPGQVFGMCSVNPHFEPGVYMREITRCVHELGFVGVKIVAHAHAWNPWSRRGPLPFEVAEALDIPLMAHTASGIPFGLPSGFIPLARRFPEVRLILAHAGSFFFEDEHLIVAEECPNVYLDTSTREPNLENLRRLVKHLGPHRFMFGSDSPDEMEHNLWQHRHIGLTHTELDWIFHRTAEEVFQL